MYSFYLSCVALLERHVYVLELAPSVYVYVEARSAVLAVLVRDLDALHYDYAALRLLCNLVAHVEVEVLYDAVLQSYLEVERVAARALRTM